MSILSLKNPRYLKPWPTILDGLMQGRKTRSYRTWGLQENLEEPLPFPKKFWQDTKGNPLNVRLSREKRKIWQTTSRQVSNCSFRNFKDRLYQKSQRYAPFLKYSSLRILIAKAVGYKQILKQGYCKNAFCNATLPDDEVTLIQPPIGDLDFQEDEY